MPRITNDIIAGLKKMDKTIQDLILGYYSLPISISPKFNTVTLGQFLAQTDRLLEQIQAFVKSNPSREEIDRIKQRLTYIPLGILNNNFNLMNKLNSIIDTYDNTKLMNQKVDELLKTEGYKNKTKADVIEKYNKILSELKSKRDKLKNQEKFIKEKFKAISEYVNDLLRKYKHTKEEKANIAAIQKMIKQRINGINKLLNKHKEVNFTGIPEQLEYIEANLNDNVTGNNIASLVTLQRIVNNLTKDVINRIKGYNPEKKKRQELLVKEQEGVLEEKKRKRLEEEEKLKKGLNRSDRDKFIVGWITKKNDDGTLYKSTFTPSELEAILRKQYPYVSDKNWNTLLSVRDLNNPRDRAILWRLMPRFNINPNKEKEYPVKDEDIKTIITRLTKYHDVPYKWVTAEKQMNLIKDWLASGINIHEIIGELNQEYTEKYNIDKSANLTKQEGKQTVILNKAKQIAQKFGIPDKINLKNILKGFGWDLDKFTNSLKILYTNRLRKARQIADKYGIPDNFNIEQLYKNLNWQLKDLIVEFKKIHKQRLSQAIETVNRLTDNAKKVNRNIYDAIIEKINNDPSFLKDMKKIEKMVIQAIEQYYQQQPKKEQEI